MTWKHRSSGSWSAPTPKVRKGGQWVSLGSGGGGGGGGSIDTSAYYTDGPPTRSGTEHTYDGTSYASLDSMLTSGDVSSGDTIYVDPSNSPYTERTVINPGDGTPNHITIYSDWDISYSSDGIATINQEGATFIRPSGETQAFRIERNIANPENYGDTALIGSYDGLHEGAETTEIEVGDGTLFSAGDSIVITEDSEPYGLGPSGGASGASNILEFANVESVSGDFLTIDQPLAMTFPNNNTAEVAVMSWTMEDLHMYGLEFQTNAGSESNVYPLYFGETYHSWFNDIVASGATSKPTIFNQASFHNRFNNVYMYDGSHYGLNSQDGTTRTMATKMMGENHNRYTVRFGPVDNSTPRGYVNNIAGNGLKRTTGGVHQGGHHVTYENLTATDTRVIVTRSWHITLDGFEVNGGNDQNPLMVCAQQPGYVTVKNGDIYNMDNVADPQVVWKFRMRGSSAPNGPERIENVTYENISIEQYGGYSKTDLGSFETESDSPEQGPLTFRNITYGGEALTQSDVEAWSGYDSNIIPDLTVE